MKSVGPMALVAALLLSETVLSSELPELEPHQILRSLQRVQDRIAAGEHAALPMQGKLLTIADNEFNKLSQTSLGEPANVKALIVYGLTGGNPRTVLKLLPAIPDADPHHALVEGISHYARGDRLRAQKAFENIDATKLDREIGASVALAIGSAKAIDKQEDAISSLKTAILLAPGTLVEEAALRRLIALHLRAGNVVEFIRSAERYARRFYRSPYANQFSDMFVAGAVGLPDQMSSGQIREVAESLPPVHRNSVYLRIARMSAVKGFSELSAQVSAFVDPGSGNPPSAEIALSEGEAATEGVGATEARSKLYAGISVLRQSGDVGPLNELQDSDAAKLPVEDRKLLSAALAVAEAISEPIEELDDKTEQTLFQPRDADAAEEQSADAASGQLDIGALDNAEMLISDVRQKLNQIDKSIEDESR